MSDADDILRLTSHRPYPLPTGPWVMFQSWQQLLFAHWSLPPEAVRAAVPPPLVLDLHEGRAWVGITPFRVDGLRVRGLPALPGASSFEELNCRTYVRLGDRTGVFFFSLDAASTAAVLGARLTYRLPYHRADMRCERDGEWLEFNSRRKDDDAAFDARYRPVGDAFHAVPGTLEYYLTERYALFAVERDGTTLRAEIHHGPWLLRQAEARITQNTVAAAAGIELPDSAPVLHFCEVQDTLIWLPERVT
jgi:uncharacterized protein